MRLPDPHRSRIALIGSSRFDRSPGLTDLPSVADNVSALRSIFTDPALCGVPVAHCPVLLDADTPAELDAWLGVVAGEADDLLLIYYAGHGVIGEDDELYLTVAESDEHHIHRSGVPFAWIKAAILNSPARTRVLILDCCFSGHALARMGPTDTAVSAALRQVDVEGTHVLTASGANVTARAPEGMAYTAFTGALLALLRAGVPGGPALLTVGYVFPLLEQMLRAAGMPRPHQQTKDTAGLLALVRNSAFTTDAESAADVALPELPVTGVPTPDTARGYRPPPNGSPNCAPPTRASPRAPTTGWPPPTTTPATATTHNGCWPRRSADSTRPTESGRPWPGEPVSGVGCNARSSATATSPRGSSPGSWCS